MARLSMIVPLTIGFVLILLYTAFNSLRHATLIIAKVPFAIIGGIVGLFATGQYLWVPSVIGFIAVLRVAMLNGIAVETAQVIEELIEMAKRFQEAAQRGESLGLNSDEMAFYDALAMNEAAVRELGDATLKKIAVELTMSLRKRSRWFGPSAKLFGRTCG